MIGVKPIQEKSKQAEICAMFHIEYNVDTLMYGAYIEGKLVGCCQFGMPKGVGQIVDLAPTGERSASVEEALFIMGRAALNFIDLCGVHEAYIAPPAETEEPLMRKIGFRPTEDGKWYMNLEGFFASPCSHH